MIKIKDDKRNTWQRGKEIVGFKYNFTKMEVAASGRTTVLFPWTQQGIINKIQKVTVSLYTKKNIKLK